MSDELKRRVCYYCAKLPRNAHCGICDPQPSDGALTNEGADPVAWMSESSEGTVFYGADPSPLLAKHKGLITIFPLYRRASILKDCEVRSAASTACTCPSGDGSLRWPCPVHPPEVKALVLPNDDDFFKFMDDYRLEKTPYWTWRACLNRVKELNS